MPALRLLVLLLTTNLAACQPGVAEFQQSAYLKAAIPQDDAEFGRVIAMSGDTLVVGAQRENGYTGAAYVFINVGGHWQQQAVFRGSRGADSFGHAVAIDGDTIVVGAISEDSAATGVDGDSTDVTAGSAGAAYVFIREATQWSQQGYLKASNTGAGDVFGYSVAISGDTIVVGAPYESSNTTGVNGDGDNDSAWLSGAAYVFVRNAGAWSHQAFFKASNTGYDDRFGWSVAVSGDSAVVGATAEDSGYSDRSDDDSARGAGAAYAFRRTGASWIQEAYIKSPVPDVGDNLGSAIALRDGRLAAGAMIADSPLVADSGAVLIFERLADGTWPHVQRVYASNPHAGDRFGLSLSLANDHLAVGAFSEDRDGIQDLGAAYLFRLRGSTWEQQAYLTASNPTKGDLFGHAVAVTRHRVAVGAFREDGRGFDDAGGPTDDFLHDAGAVYIFSARAPSITSIAASPMRTLLKLSREPWDQTGVAFTKDLSAGGWIDIGDFVEGSFLDTDPTRTGQQSGFYRAFLR